jgi:SP family general alpha glucoside:H+ symporter-like MFS transporter
MYAYRLSFLLQWVWPVPIMMGIAWAAESPGWLVRGGQDGATVLALRKLYKYDDELIAFAAMFMLKAGLEPQMAFVATTILQFCGMLETAGAWFVMSHLGRRTLYLWGFVALTIILVAMGILGAVALKAERASWFIVTMASLPTSPD